jgi:hypothetical protein
MSSLRPFIFSIVALLGAAHGQILLAQNVAGLSVLDTGKALTFRHGEQEIATYVFSDEKILRPFFANVRTPGGVKVSRNFPPIAGTDQTDHDTMHPGIWLAFGDISGNDFWRNKAKVQHVGFIEPPTSEDSTARFVQQKRYLDPEGNQVCNERCQCIVRVMHGGVLIEIDSTFSSNREFFFGDQEEMGLGIRVATEITEKRGGRITDSEGRSGAGEVWSQPSSWCNYSGQIREAKVGMTILCHPENFRASWMHARDYGVIAANAFGRSAMGKGPPDKTIVRPGETLRLRYGVYAHQATHDPAAIYRAYINRSDEH